MPIYTTHPIRYRLKFIKIVLRYKAWIATLARLKAQYKHDAPAKARIQAMLDRRRVDFFVACAVAQQKYVVLYQNGERVGSFEWFTMDDRKAIYDDMRANGVKWALIQRDVGGTEHVEVWK